MAMLNSTELSGTRLLREIDGEAGSLEDVLKDVRLQNSAASSRTGLIDLDGLWLRHGGRLSITGRYLALIYHLVSSWVNRNGTVVVVDLEGQFSPSHLCCELQHVHVFRATQSNLKVTLESLEQYMLWGEHRSQAREWVGTIVIGGVGGDVCTGWRGWLRVEREETIGFGMGISAEEATWERQRRQEVVDKRGWRASSDLGEFSWRLDEDNASSI